MKVSIALCTYNGERFLKEQLASFLLQTRLPDELVVCDDCSTDSTLKILEDFAKEVPFEVRICKNEVRLGSYLNFEKAVSLCKGDIIFLSDQDDVWASEKIEFITSKFAEFSSIGMVFSDAELVDENLCPLNKRLWEFYFPKKKREKAKKVGIFEVLLEANVVTGATMAFRAKLKESFLPFPKDISGIMHDGWISLCASLISDVYFTENPLIKYRIHRGQQIGIGIGIGMNIKRMGFSETVEIIKEDIDRLRKIGEVLRRYQGLKLPSSELIQKVIERKESNILHLENRLKLPEKKFSRILPIFKELLSGRYNEFSKGFLSAVKDFFQKPS